MKIKEAEYQARLKAIRDNYEMLSSRDDWASCSKIEKAAMMELECGMSRQALAPLIKELGITL